MVHVKTGHRITALITNDHGPSVSTFTDCLFFRLFNRLRLLFQDIDTMAADLVVYGLKDSGTQSIIQSSQKGAKSCCCMASVNLSLCYIPTNKRLADMHAASPAISRSRCVPAATAIEIRIRRQQLLNTRKCLSAKRNEVLNSRHQCTGMLWSNSSASSSRT